MAKYFSIQRGTASSFPDHLIKYKFKYMEIGAFEMMLIASTLLEFNPVIQAVKIIRLKEAKDVSVYTFFMILVIGAMWLAYGIRIDSLPLIIGNAIKLFSSTTVVVVYLLYKQPKQEKTS
jgi:uncharacterized protein with PQ loop repeat